MKKTILGAIVFASLAFTAQAELMSTDVHEMGDAGATLDTSTGLEWLKVSRTFNYSYNEIINNFQTDGVFEGWRYATREELETLMLSENGFLHDLNDTSYISNTSSSFNAEGAEIFNQYFTEEGKTSYGMIRNEGSGLSLSGVNIGSSNAYYWHSNYSQAAKYGHIGHWLVSDGGTTYSSKNNPEINRAGFSGDVNAVADVPVSLSALLLSAGLLGLRRKKIV